MRVLSAVDGYKLEERFTVFPPGKLGSPDVIPTSDSKAPELEVPNLAGADVAWVRLSLVVSMKFS